MIKLYLLNIRKKLYKLIKCLSEIVSFNTRTMEFEGFVDLLLPSRGSFVIVKF